MTAPTAARAAEARRNALLRLVPPDVWDTWCGEVEVVALRTREVLLDPGAPLHYVHFPVSCVLSVMQVLGDGASSQVAVIGREGLVGAPAFLGHPTSGTCVIVQLPGLAARLPADVVIGEFERSGRFMQLLMRHVQAVIAQMAQTAVCNRHHSPEQQLCRWILMTLDRVDGPELPATQDLVATMLGVRRETVSEAARKLQAGGVVQLRRGHLLVLDRPALERHACECYASIRREYAKLFSPLVAKAAAP